MTAKKIIRPDESANVNSLHDGSLIRQNEIPTLSMKEEMLEKCRDQILRMQKEIEFRLGDLLRWQVAIGSMLLDVKAMTSHGRWRRWLKENFEANTKLCERTAQRYMQTASGFRKFLIDRGYVTDENCGEQLHLNLEYLSEFQVLSQKDDATVGNKSADPNDWASPPAVIQAVKTVLGNIDCATCTSLNNTASFAEIHYTTRENGLADENSWPGTVWVNPGHTGDCVPWCLKALREFENGNLSDAILCLPVSLHTAVPALLRFPFAVTHTPLMVTDFHKGKQKQLPANSIFVYVSAAPNFQQFATAFRDIAVAFAPLVVFEIKSVAAAGK